MKIRTKDHEEFAVIFHTGDGAEGIRETLNFLQMEKRTDTPLIPLKRIFGSTHMFPYSFEEMGSSLLSYLI